MEDCVFCKIVKGEIPCYNVYEDEDFLAFLDINPVNPGHSLVIPKKHYRWVWSVENIGKYFEVVRNVVKKTQKAMNTQFIACGIAGNDIPHAHIHVVPRFENDGHGGFIDPKNIKKILKEEMEEIAEKIRKSF